MIVEDAHWVDPTSLEVFGRTVDQIKTLPVLLIVTFRPEFNAPWAGRSHVTSLALNRLGEREAATIIASLVGNKELPADLMAEIVERTDGIPLFVEEMTKAVLEAESEGQGRETAAAVPYSALSVPPSLHASLMARLDRLGPAKEVAQIGATIGREFSHALLAAVARKPETELVSALDRLVAAGLVFPQGVPPHATYLFKHALVQDAAYGTLLREPRRALHARIAETLEREFVDISEAQPELLARHCTEAGLIAKAVGLWGKAGKRSLERSALVERRIAWLINWPCLRLKRMLSSGRRAQRICGLGLSPNLAPPLMCLPPFQPGSTNGSPPAQLCGSQGYSHIRRMPMRTWVTSRTLGKLSLKRCA